MNKYFVYVFLDPNSNGVFKYKDYEFEFEPFYVGKGSGKRIEKHFNYYVKKSKDQTYKYRKIRSIISKGQTPIIKKIIENVSEKEAFFIECDLIKKIGRYDCGFGPLTNHTDGGEGVSGKFTSEETKKKISESLKKCGRIYKPHTEEYKEYMRNFMKGRISPMKGKNQSVEAKKKISKNNARCKTRAVLQLDKDGNFIKEWPNMTSACNEFNIHMGSMCRCCKYELKYVGGYVWRYKNEIKK